MIHFMPGSLFVQGWTLKVFTLAVTLGIGIEDNIEDLIKEGPWDRNRSRTKN